MSAARRDADARGKAGDDDVRQLNDDYTPEQAVRMINQMMPSNARSYVSVVAGVALSSVNGREARLEIGYTIYVSIVRDDRAPFLHCGHVGPLNQIKSLNDFCRNLQKQIDAWSDRRLTRAARDLPTARRAASRTVAAKPRPPA
jgi:hypothetical protein